jgi:hypothetical protein
MKVYDGNESYGKPYKHEETKDEELGLLRSALAEKERDIVVLKNEILHLDNSILEKKKECDRFTKLIYQRINEVKTMADDEYRRGNEKLHYGWGCRMAGLTDALDILEKAKQALEGEK